mmetsp:Transcript_9464/g.8468  ORF Transcript_9464/g.8468 Transcript_9464/m.8468 type:complete len:87 (+) Transcript_9464:124-384(+)
MSSTKQLYDKDCKQEAKIFFNCIRSNGYECMQSQNVYVNCMYGYHRNLSSNSNDSSSISNEANGSVNMIYRMQNEQDVSQRAAKAM